MAKRAAGFTRTVLQHKPDQRLCDDDFVQSCNMRVEELSMVVYFSCQVRIVFVGGFQNNLGRYCQSSSSILPTECPYL